MELCEPCGEQGNQRSALYWCCSCSELLCENCHDHHKVLKVTRNHKFLGIRNYRKIGTNIANLGRSCQNCKKEKAEFICQTHNQPCCMKCKRKLHGEGCDGKTTDEILQTLPSKLVETTKRKIGNLSLDISKRMSIQTDITSGLEEQRKLFYKELRSGREKVVKFLDDFEESVKRDFEYKFASAIKKNSENIIILEKTRFNLNQRKETFDKVVELGNFPEPKMYLLANKFHKENVDDQTFINSVREQACDIFPKPVFEIDKESKVITLLESIENKIKTEDPIQSEEPANRTSKGENETEEQDTASSTVEAEEERAKSLFTADDIQKIADAIANSIIKAWSSYKLEKQFIVEHHNEDISINCARFLKDDEIVMTESSENRVLVYYTDGKKKGQLLLNEPPDEIAVLTIDKVVVSCPNSVVFIDTDTMVKEGERKFRDTVQGIAHANGEIYVCLQHKGMNVLDVSGNILRYIPCIRGDLYVYATDNGCLFSAKRTSDVNKYIGSYCQKTNQQDRYYLDDDSGVNGMTRDKKGIIYVATLYPSIITLNSFTKKFSTALTAEDGLVKPYSVDCCKDNGQLLVIDDGKEVKLFSQP